MNRLIFHNEKRGEIHLKIKPIRIAESIEERLGRVEEVRCRWRDFELREGVDLNRPTFFEWQEIEVISYLAEGSGFKKPFTFYLNKKPYFESRKIGQQEFLTGVFRLRDAVGYTDFVIKDRQGREVFKLETEVFPQKMDYKEDFRNMLTEIKEVVYNLAYGHLQKTYALARPKDAEGASLGEWRAILEHLMESLENSLDVVLKNLKTKIASTNEVKEVAKVKRSSRSVQKWILKNRKYLNTKEGFRLGKHFVSHLPEQKKQISYNTFENRFVVWAVKQLIAKVEVALRVLREMPSSATVKEEIAKLDQYRYRLRHRLNDQYLSRVEPFENQWHFSTTLTMAPGYKDFYKRFLLLQKGLSIFEDEFCNYKIDFKKISTLYEYWCFLKIVKILKEEYDLETSDLIQVKNHRFVVNLKIGNASKIVYKNPETEEEFYLFFNRKFSRKDNHTNDLKPDYVIELRKKGYEGQPILYILDAKYRFAKDWAGQPLLDAPEDAIGQLHVYRDGIIIGKKERDQRYIRAIKSLGGVILYPYPNDQEEFRENKYYQSLEEVNIGALPLLPRGGGDQLLKEFLKELITKTPERHFEEQIVNDTTSYELHERQMNTVCLIGLVRNVEHDKRLHFYKKNKAYAIQYKSMKGPIYKSQHIALSSKGQLIAHGEVTGYEIYTKSEMQDIGANWVMKSKKYVLFKVKKWEDCELVDPEGKRAGYNFATYFGFLKLLHENISTALKINSFHSARLWQELNNRDLEFTITREGKFQTDKKNKLIFKLKDNRKILVDPVGERKAFLLDGVWMDLGSVLERLG